jgi:outer membrane assembly lipoprotein YfiO
LEASLVIKSVIRYILLSALLCFAVGCVQKSAKLQKSIAPPDKTLFQTGSVYLQRGQFIKSRLAFQTLLNTYPDSDMAAESYFAMGDSFYEEGGTENYLQAEDQYKNFIIFYPGNPKSADAQMKIISLNYKMMRTPDRDPQYARKTLQEIKAFEQRYGDSDLLPFVRQMKSLVEDNLAQGDYGVGEFYLARGNLSGAKLRFQEIPDQYKNYAEMDAVLFRLGEISEKLNNPEEAAKHYSKLAQGYPFSKYSDQTKTRLIALGKEIPSVDKELADANLARLKPDAGFSPLRPLIDFGKALGFVPLPDQYKKAKQTVEEEKIKTALTASGTPEEGSDIQIETVITKSASGSTQDGTASGENTVNPPANGDDKKNSRYKRKNNKKP